MEVTSHTSLPRPLRGMEIVFFRTPEANVSLVARLKGAVTEEGLKRALKQVQQTHPLLSAHCRVADDQAIELVANPLAELPLKIIPRQTDEQWITAIQTEYKIPFDFESGPLIRFVLLQSPDLSDLLIYCQHIICDGLSLANLAQEIVQLLNDPAYKLPAEPAVSLPPAPPPTGLGPRIMTVVKKVFINRFNNQWHKTKIAFTKDDFLSIQQAYFSNHHIEILVAELSEAETQSLVEACRKNQVTVNSALSVAFLAGRLAVVGDYANNLQSIGVSLRPHISKPANNVFGCLVGDIGLKFKYDAAQDFWCNVRGFHQQLRQALDTQQDLQSLADLGRIDPGLMEAMTFARHINFIPEAFVNHPKLAVLLPTGKHIAASLSKDGMSSYPGLLITNMGALKSETKSGPITLEKFFFAPSTIPLPSAGLIVGVVTLNQRLVITLNVALASNEDSAARIKLFNQIKEQTLAFIRKAMV